MNMLMFSIFDDKASIYSRPFYALTVGEAIRTFTDAINTPDSPYNRHPEDYTLYSVGTFNDQDAEVQDNTPNNLGNATSYLHQPEIYADLSDKLRSA